VTKIGEDMRLWREVYRLTQAQAATLTGVSVTTWSRWERGLMAPPLREWQRLESIIAASDVCAQRVREGIA
jgi:transcriptional regulator with XRE-family HTH domain